MRKRRARGRRQALPRIPMRRMLLRLCEEYISLSTLCGRVAPRGARATKSKGGVPQPRWVPQPQRELSIRWLMRFATPHGAHPRPGITISIVRLDVSGVHRSKSGQLMSAMGHKHKTASLTHVRFTPESRQSADMLACPLCAISDRTQRSKKLLGHLVVAANRPRFRGTGGGILIRLPRQSAVMLAARITLPHFSVSSTINFSNSVGVFDNGSTPKPASRAFMVGSAAMALISLLSFSITS